jgi:hypothetical protein
VRKRPNHSFQIKRGAPAGKLHRRGLDHVMLRKAQAARPGLENRRPELH